ncbi:MAG: T9SS type A sorting domain-containing protein [bacterium]
MNNNNNLDKYFLQARKAENPQSFFSDDEIRSITEKGYHGGSTNPLSNILKILKRNKIMTATSLIIVGSILWFSFTNTGEQNSYESGITNHRKEDSKTNTGIIANTDNLSERTITGMTEENTKSENYGLSKNIIQIPIIILSEKELNKIGICESGGGYSFVSYKIVSNDGSIVPELNTIDTFGLKKVTDEFFAVPDIADLVPTGIISNYMNHEGNRAIISQAFENTPYMLGDAIEELQFELFRFLDTVAIYRNKGIRDKDYLKINTDNFPLVKSLLPVYLHAGDKNTGSDILVWYLPNKAFIERLPERYKKPILENKRTKELVEYSFKESYEKKKKEEKTIFRAKFNDPQKSYWKELIYNTQTKQVEGIPQTHDDKVKNIGNVQLTVGELKKIMNNLHFELEQFKPPSIDILRYENNTDKFNANLYQTIERAKKSDDIDNYIAKIQLYGYIAKLIAYDIQGIEEIKLNDEELKKVNVFKDSSGYYALRDFKYDIEHDTIPERQLILSSLPQKKVFTKYGPTKKELAENGWDTTITIGYYRKKIEMKRTKYSEEILKYQGWNINETLNIQPSAISNIEVIEIQSRKNTQPLKIASTIVFNNSPALINADSLFNSFKESSIYNLIPIKIGYYNLWVEDTIKSIQTEYTLWYVLNEDLVNALPERYRESLRKELELIAGIEDGTISAEEACNAIKGKESYLDLCRYESDAIKDLKVYPNPNTSNEVKLQFKLSKRCSIRIDVHELSGRLISNVGNIPCAPGEQNLILEFRRFIPSSGVYLISITTSTGEQVVRRFIVE